MATLQRLNEATELKQESENEEDPEKNDFIDNITKKKRKIVQENPGMDTQ